MQAEMDVLNGGSPSEGNMDLLRNKEPSTSNPACIVSTGDISISFVYF